MNYLTFINHVVQYDPIPTPVQFLVSGNDPLIRNTVLYDVVKKAHENNQTIIMVDDTGNSKQQELNLNEISEIGYSVNNGMAGDYCLHNPFQAIGTIKGMSQIRQLFTTIGYDEKQKMKLVAYLNFIRHVEGLETENSNLGLTLNILSKYSTNLSVERKLQCLLESGIIDGQQQMYLLTKYSEICSAAADFEDMLFLLAPFICGDSVELGNESNQAIVFQTGELGEDENLRNLIMQLLQFGIEEGNKKNITVLVMDKGYGDRKCIINFLKALPSEVRVHIFSEDIFTLCEASMLSMLLNRFTARVYSRHLAMESCQAIEKACGDIDVAKNSYTVNYDRRWNANRPWDVLFGRNKTETYTRCAPVREPRYRKEMIAGLAQGRAIVEYMGNTSIFTI